MKGKKQAGKKPPPKMLWVRTAEIDGTLLIEIVGKRPNVKRLKAKS
jgi:hypothetical protein